MTDIIVPPPPMLIRYSKTKCSCCANNVSFAFHNKCIQCADVNSIEYNYHLNNTKKYINKILNIGFSINDIDHKLLKYFLRLSK